ncbi:peptidoglycan DD-metalloendopeptidase family protein [Shewanella sp. NIFS-20-20]|uniref:murein hydrolase activator EnvC family protein n=1 Tax=Shewanella sp. NIFS-20-20 TaxID=2853806 RepID=UPI001C44B0D9|nr:peptidoglycan DD-metalloendopeptidase family protein [Shewanella sp. NIFS-20-20]
MSFLPNIKACIIAGFFILASPTEANELSRRQAELKQIQQEISKQHNAVSKTTKQRQQLQALLKQDELAIAAIARKAAKTRGQLADTQKQLEQLNSQFVELNAAQDKQQKTLAKQLSGAYLAGNHDYSKMLLNQQQPATIERMLAYYQYLNNARISAIETLKQTVADLQRVQQQQLAHQDQLNQLILTQQQQQEQLANEQIQRQQTLTQLQRTLNSQGAQLEQLQLEEGSIKHLMQQATKVMDAHPNMEGLAKSRGKLAWPVNGKVQASFGSQRSGRVNWKGVLLKAPEGRVVEAIASGKVIYADWLKGFGMVLVVDHGQGYMSLYGYAQALLKNVGDSVAKGERVALVGQSGGQTEPGLYFEIRHKGQAIDPANYCRRK